LKAAERWTVCVIPSAASSGTAGVKVNTVRYHRAGPWLRWRRTRWHDRRTAVGTAAHRRHTWDLPKKARSVSAQRRWSHPGRHATGVRRSPDERACGPAPGVDDPDAHRWPVVRDGIRMRATAPSGRATTETPQSHARGRDRKECPGTSRWRAQAVPNHRRAEHYANCTAGRYVAKGCEGNFRRRRPRAENASTSVCASKRAVAIGD
jgi:hypothetical protein